MSAPPSNERPAPRVLFVADRTDAPYRYRCESACLQLRAAGVSADVRMTHDPAIFDALARARVVVLFRLPWSDTIGRLLDRARAAGATIVFDCDDLIFDPARIGELHFLADGPAWLRLRYADLAARLFRTLQAADTFIGPTAALVRAAEQLGKPAHIHPNLLHPTLLRIAARIRPLRPLLRRRNLIGYMSGSATHNADFAAIAPAVRRFLDERQDVSLAIGGHLELDAAFDAYGDRVIRLPFMDWRVQPWALAVLRVNLAPLARLDDFTNAKSALKFFEAGAVGVPTVASPSEPFAAAIRPGENGLLATTTDEWHSAIHECLERSETFATAARRSALAEHSPAAYRGRLAEILSKLCGQPLDDAAPQAEIPDFDGRGRPLTPIERARERIARGRAVIGIFRRASDPRKLHQPAPSAAGGLATVVIDAPEKPESSRRVLLGDGTLAGAWRAAASLTQRVDADGATWRRAADADPWLESPPIDTLPTGANAIHLRLVAHSDHADCYGQLFWRPADAAGYRETNSLRFPVIADGRPHHYRIDLAGSTWPRGDSGPVQLRFDPLDAPGRFHIAELSIEYASETPPNRLAAPIAATGVDIVAPIYNARRDVERCVESVLRHAGGSDWRLVLVDDASTDAELVAFLDRVAASDERIVLLRNERNGGFVVTANRGMRHAAGRDVLLLNSDTVATAGFLETLRDACHADAATAIACPLTNNGTICSAPNWLVDNPLPVDRTVDEYAGLIRTISLRRRPELVTAVGFCMYIRADVIARVGLFDEAAFGRGFGEENDFCERAKAAGYRIVLVDDLFVAHTGKASFAAEGKALEHANAKVLDRMHPRYFADVAEFCRARPIDDILANLRYHDARRTARRHRAMLFVLHADPFARVVGGTEHAVRDLVQRLALPRSVLLYPDFDALVAAEVNDGDVAAPRLHRFDVGTMLWRYSHRDAAAEALFAALLERFDVGLAHLQHMLGLPVGLWRSLVERDIPYFYSVHDFYCLCPSLNLMHHERAARCPCAVADPASAGCIASQFRTLGLTPPRDADAFLAAHRAEFEQLLQHAAAIVAPSQAALDEVRLRYPALRPTTQVIEHGYDTPQIPESRDHAPGATLRVALLGQIAYPAKGAANYLDLLTRARDLPIEWHVFGDVTPFDYGERLRRAAGSRPIRLHGRYERESICGLLTAQRVDAAVMLPIAPETFCFTLSEAWLAGVPAVVGDCGALPERVTRSGAGLVVADAAGAAAALGTLCRDRDRLAALSRAARAFRHADVAENAAAHRRVYGDLLRSVEEPSIDRPFGEADRLLFRAWYNTPQERAADAVPPPLLPYQRQRWYSWYRKLRGIVPPAARTAARRIALRFFYPAAPPAEPASRP